jgi:hypothetical protein
MRNSSVKPLVVVWERMEQAAAGASSVKPLVAVWEQLEQRAAPGRIAKNNTVLLTPT